VSGQLHAPAALPPGKEPPSTHGIGDWVGPRAGLDDVEKEKILDPYQESNSDPSAVQPVASCYTDCAINNRTILENVYTRVNECWLNSGGNIVNCNGMSSTCSNTARAAITINRVLC
jgi:hypothetical protein